MGWNSDIVVLILLFMLSGFFSSSEAALLSLRDLHLHKMQQNNYPFFNYVVKLLSNQRRLLITIVTSNEVVNVSISILAASFFIGLLGSSGQWVSIVFTTVVLLFVGEAIPKTFGVTYPMQISSLVSPILMAVSRIESPVVSALEKVSGLFLRCYGVNKSEESEVIMEHEFKTLVDVGSLEGVVNEAQKELINKIFELGDRPVTDIMVPRVDMFCLPLDMPVGDMLQSVAAARQERVPVYREDRDDIVGILFARDLLNNVWRGRLQTGIFNLLARPFFVPEQKTINGLLHDFQKNFIQIAIVVDEYGGVSGMITLEHILEHLFEETEGDEEMVCDGCEKIDEQSIIVPGSMSVEQCNKLLEAELPEDEFDTVGGLVLHLFGKIPKKGEEAHLGGYVFCVHDVGKTRILKVRITKKTVEEPEES
ncbi:MAG TPA: hemolysin family protein [Smithella sp.]|nr:hemolysin family protein [Smithella sp.]HQP41216.1 hemolysin family protein [Smithella sp.]